MQYSTGVKSTTAYFRNMKNNLIEIQIEIEKVRERKQKHMNLEKNLSIDDIQRVNSIHNTPKYADGFEEEQRVQYKSQLELLEALGTPDELAEFKYQQAQMAYMNQLEKQHQQMIQNQQQQSNKLNQSLKEKWHQFLNKFV